MRLGFIGTGSMGSMLIRAFAKEGQSKLQLAACNRSPDKVHLLCSDIPALTVYETEAEIVLNSDHIFLCVRPLDAGVVLNKISPLLKANQTLYSLISSIPLSEIEAITDASVIKIIPSITQVARAGVCLVMTSEHSSPSAQQEAFRLLEMISKPFRIQEADVRACSDLASCGPAFISFILRQFVEAAVSVGHLNQELAKSLVSEMIYGVGKLVTQEGFSFESIISRVSVPGGVTAAGIQVLEPRLEGIFEDVLRATQLKQQSHTAPLPPVQSDLNDPDH